MMRSSEISSLRRVETVVPSRMIVIRSATREISFSLWLMMIVYCASPNDKKSNIRMMTTGMLYS